MINLHKRKNSDITIYFDIDDLEKTLPIFIETYVNQSINICFTNKETVINFILKSYIRKLIRRSFIRKALAVFLMLTSIS